MKVSSSSRDLALILLEDEAERKKDERVIIGGRAYTYFEVVNGLKNGDKRFKRFLDGLASLIDSSEEVRKVAISLVDKKGVGCSSPI